MPNLRPCDALAVAARVPERVAAASPSFRGAARTMRTRASAS
ncbi:hypothetical protein [Agromyces tropicus]